MNNQIQVQPMQQLCQSIDKMHGKFAELLPANVSPETFAAKTKNAIQRHPQADKLLSADRKTLFNSMLRASEDGLMLDGREATLVTFKNEVQYMPMVQGLVKLARNSGEIKKIYADVVYDNDDFNYSPQDSVLDFKPDWFGDRGEPKGAFCLITLTNGETIHSVMPKKRIIQIGNGGRNGYQYDPVKGAHFEEWWKKTVIKNALKYAPKSTSLDMAMSHDNDAQGYDYSETEHEVDNNTYAEPIEAATTAAEALVVGEDNVIEGDVI